MADMTYAELAGSTYDELSAKTYAFTADETSGDDGTGGDDTGGSSSVSCLWTEARIAAIERKLSEVLSKMDTLAKPEDVKLTTTTQTVQVTTQEVDLSEVLSKMDTLAKPEDVKLTTTTQTVQVTTQEVDLSEVLSKMDTLAKPEDVKVSVNADGIDLSEVTGLLEKIFALIARWKISGNMLTAYASNGSVIGTFNVTRDADGIITEVCE